MEYLIQIFSAVESNFMTTRLLFVIAIGLSIALFGWGVMVLFTNLFNPVRRRLDDLHEKQVSAERAPQSQSKLLNAAGPIARRFQPTSGKEFNNLRTMLQHAGFMDPKAMENFYALKVLLILVLVSAVLVGAEIFPYFSTKQVFITAVLAAFTGLMLPAWGLGFLAEKRARQLMDGFPDTLDLLVVCTEAGLGLNSAIERVSREMCISYPMLSEELGLVNAEIRAGVDRVTALRNLADRTGLEGIRGLVSLLTQSLRFGTSIAETLRIYSDEFRDKRMQRAEEQAAMVGTKMIFPLVLCIFPAFFVVAVGPALLGVMNALGNL